MLGDVTTSSWHSSHTLEWGGGVVFGVQNWMVYKLNKLCLQESGVFKMD